MIVVRVAQQAAVRSQLPSLQGRGGRDQCGKHWLQKPAPQPTLGQQAQTSLAWTRDPHQAGISKTSAGAGPWSSHRDSRSRGDC